MILIPLIALTIPIMDRVDEWISGVGSLLVFLLTLLLTSASRGLRQSTSDKLMEYSMMSAFLLAACSNLFIAMTGYEPVYIMYLAALKDLCFVSVGFIALYFMFDRQRATWGGMSFWQVLIMGFRKLFS